MTTNLCPCADLDWREVDQTAQHHPECKWFTVKIPYDRVEVQTVTIDAPPVGGISAFKLLGDYQEIGREDIERFYGSMKEAIRQLTGNDISEMPDNLTVEVSSLPGFAANPEEWRLMGYQKISFTHCDVQSVHDVYTESYALRCTKCNEIIVSRGT